MLSIVAPDASRRGGKEGMSVSVHPPTPPPAPASACHARMCARVAPPCRVSCLPRYHIPHDALCRPNNHQPTAALRGRAGARCGSYSPWDQRCCRCVVQVVQGRAVCLASHPPAPPPLPPARHRHRPPSTRLRLPRRARQRHNPSRTARNTPCAPRPCALPHVNPSRRRSRSGQPSSPAFPCTCIAGRMGVVPELRGGARPVPAAPALPDHRDPGGRGAGRGAAGRRRHAQSRAVRRAAGGGSTGCSRPGRGCSGVLRGGGVAGVAGRGGGTPCWVVEG